MSSSVETARAPRRYRCASGKGKGLRAFPAWMWSEIVAGRENGGRCWTVWVQGCALLERDPERPPATLGEWDEVVRAWLAAVGVPFFGTF